MVRMIGCLFQVLHLCQVNRRVSVVFYRIIDKHSHIFLRDGIDFDEEAEIGIVTEPFEGMIRAKWDFDKECWVETITPEERICLEYGVNSIGEALSIIKEEKISELRLECNQKIIDGFKLDGEHYSYSQEKQINFQDTYQLFLNNMITEISWNAYIDGEKTRLVLDKDKFQRVYLAGVKHKVDIMSRLNDVLIPMINSAERKEVVARIYWDEGLDSESLELDTGNTIDKKIERVEKTTKEVQDSSLTTMMALLQVSALIK